MAIQLRLFLVSFSARRTTQDAPASWVWDSLAPGASLPFAWDDITAKHVVEVAAEVLTAGGRSLGDAILREKQNRHAFEIDTLQVCRGNERQRWGALGVAGQCGGCRDVLGAAVAVDWPHAAQRPEQLLSPANHSLLQPCACMLCHCFLCFAEAACYRAELQGGQAWGHQAHRQPGHSTHSRRRSQCSPRL